LINASNALTGAVSRMNWQLGEETLVNR
jgi:hypothetical protein